MKTIRNLLMCAVALLAVGCDKDDTFEVTPQTLAQTVWDAEIEYFDENGNATGNNSCIVEFLSETEGKYSEPDMNTVRRFTYEVDRAIIVIDSGSYTLLNGTWHIVEKSEQQILLQGYYPNKTVVTLNRIL
ncbi:MAG: hypothetical protein IKU88_07530 [Alistipes sp.]|nr:hypothetical protein [Alistipes sp.]